ncbi:oligosaccharide flippase family protein [Halococcus dombrowskii]|uniref:Flippase n=2 Tax=Halococcus TaxID=2249 RepID=A0AAV3SBP8_HALDO|nr:oligosaccharide flippase family protein [Halococcus dombrowskii]UOO94451.1 oligosaccharide flippase family protein [Halococcus dombrowskii]
MTSNEDMADDRTGLTGVVSSASLVLVGSLLGSSSKLVERVIIARLLPPGAYGQVSLGIAVMSLGLTLGIAGFDQGVPRFMSRFEDERDRRGTWLTGLALSAVVTLIVTALLLFRLEWIIDTIFDGTAPLELVALFVLAIPVLVGQKIGVGGVRGFENTIYRTYARDLLYNGLRLGLLVALLFAGFGVFAAGYAYVIAGAAGFIAIHYFLNRLLTLRGPVRTHGRQLLWFSLPLLFSAAVTKLLSQIDTIMLGAYLSNASVGIYDVAYPLALGLGVIFSSFGFIYLPLTSRFDASGRRGELDRVHKLTAKWTVLIGFPVFLTFAAFPTDIVNVVFGDEYIGQGVGTTLAILSSGFFVSGMAGYCQNALSGLGYTRSILAVNVISAVANIVLNVLLIPRYGIVGAAAASALSFATLNWVAFAFLYRVAGISPFSRYTVKMYVFLPLLLFPPAFALSSTVSLSLLTIPLFGVVAGLATLVICAVTGCFQPEDEIPLELIEGRLGVRIPYIRRYIPDEN